jgi:hypothetical protein
MMNSDENTDDDDDDDYYYYYCYNALQPFVGPCPLFQFLDPIYTVGRTPWTGDQPVARTLPTHRTTQTHGTR